MTGDCLTLIQHHVQFVMFQKWVCYNELSTAVGTEGRSNPRNAPTILNAAH